ncbi:DUF2610 domain-containing protein [Dactylosporangium sp. CA-139066]|uniref:DUF2610 domain-containing protein n=1 Tax=Dactylosporangium sp. CA-139066 TaxID=3239930 RepID=UPI003D901430
MRRIMLECDFAGERAPFNVYIGAPAADAHPLEQQAAWLRRERGGEMPAWAMDLFARLHREALGGGMTLEDATRLAFEAELPHDAADIIDRATGPVSDEPPPDASDPAAGSPATDASASAGERAAAAIDALGALPATDTTARAIRHARAYGGAAPLTTGRLFNALASVDAEAEWGRLFLHTGDLAQTRVALEPDDPAGDTGEPGADGVPLTAELWRSLRLAAALAETYELAPVPPGALALALVAYPRSGAARALTRLGNVSHRALVDLVMTCVLGIELNNVWDVIARHDA